MEAHLAPKQLVPVNKISSTCEICSGPHDTQYCMEILEQAFVDYASSHTNKAGVRSIPLQYAPSNQINFMMLNRKEKSEKTRATPQNIDTTPPSPPDPSISFLTKKGNDGDVMFIAFIRRYDDSHDEGPKDEKNERIEVLEVEYFDIFPTRSKIAYHKYLMSGPIPSLFLRNPIITEGCPNF
nr:MAK10-like protein [Tanacetum cinerariifolium]